MTTIHLVDSSDSDDDDDFIAPIEPPPRLRQTLLDEYTLKRDTPEEAEDVRLLDDTLLAPFVDDLVLSPGDVVRVDPERPYNYMDFRLDGVHMQVWQATLDEIEGDNLSFARIVDLGANGKRQRTSLALVGDVDKLRRLGWGDSGKIKERLDTTALNTPAKRAYMAAFLQETFHLIRSILEQSAVQEQKQQQLPIIVVFACARGLERSLILFNLIAYAATLGVEDRQGRHASIDDLCAHVASHFQLRHERVDGDGKEARIKNELIHSTIDSLPSLIQLSLKVPLTQRSAKKQRFEQRKPCGYYMYC
jgi:hypothetical protein